MAVVSFVRNSFVFLNFYFLILSLSSTSHRQLENETKSTFTQQLQDHAQKQAACGFDGWCLSTYYDASCVDGTMYMMFNGNDQHILFESNTG